MIKTKSKRLLGVLLSAALLASMALPSGVTAAEVGEAVGVTSSTAATEATATDTATEEVTTIAEVSETAATVDSAEVVEEDEEVTVIDEVSETAETVETATGSEYTYVLNDCSNSSTVTAQNQGERTISSYTLSDSTSETGAVVTPKSTATGSVWFGAAVSSMTSTYTTAAGETSAGDGIYFQIYDVSGNINVASTMMQIRLVVNGTTYYRPNTNNNVNVSVLNTAGEYLSTSSSITYSGTTSSVTLYTFYIPYSSLKTSYSDGKECSSDIVANNEFSIYATFRFDLMTGSDGKATPANTVLIYDNFGIYSATELTEAEEEPVEVYTQERSDYRDEQDVYVVQDFESSTTGKNTDVAYANNGPLTIDTGYLDGNSAQEKREANDQVRLQTSATQLMGEGLYFEIQSTSSCFIATGSSGSIYLLDTTTAYEAGTDTSAVYVTSSSGVSFESLTKSGGYTVKKISSDEDTGNYVYAIMIPWSSLGVDTGTLLTKGLCLRFYTYTDWTGTIAFDNIGFYGVSDTLGGAVQGVTDDSVEVSATIASGYGTDTVYALVDNSAGTYSNDDGDGVYPTTTLTYDNSNYIFAGWYSYTAGDTSYTKMETVPTGEAYAKFVDADMLQIGFQTADGDNSTFMLRLVSTVDCLDYQTIGFKIALYDGTYISNTVDLNDTKVYDVIYATDNDSETEMSIDTTTFSSASKYFSTAIITNISTSSELRIYSISAYVVTADGTTVVYETTASVTSKVTFGTGGTTLKELYDMTQGNSAVDGNE